jgi:hypothetical protein
LYQQQVIRNLIWAIGSPPLFNSLPFKNMKDLFVDEAFCRRLSVTHEKFFQEWDKNVPQELLEIHQKPMKLGFYFEKLLAFFFQKSPFFELIQHHLPIQGKDHHIIGELDFILFNHYTNQYEQWEVALKYYYSPDQNPVWQYWHGINPDDVLEKKMQQLLYKIPRLISSEFFREYLLKKGIKEIKRKIFFKGCLFYPYQSFQNQRFRSAFYVNPNHNKGFWGKVKNLAHKKELSSYYWKWLEKKERLSLNLYRANENFFKLQDISRSPHINRLTRGGIAGMFEEKNGILAEKTKAILFN